MDNMPPDYIEPPVREMTDEEMEQLSWDRVDDIIKTIKDEN
jgi:hypothetical protein